MQLFVIKIMGSSQLLKKLVGWVIVFEELDVTWVISFFGVLLVSFLVVGGCTLNMRTRVYVKYKFLGIFFNLNKQTYTD